MTEARQALTGKMRLNARFRRVAAGVFGLCVLPLGVLACASNTVASETPTRMGSPVIADMKPKSGISVYWVGHSLVETKAQSEWGEITLMSLVGRFAQARGLGYRMGDHTLWGSPMSALWRGKPHGYTRDASSMVPKREQFEATAGQYDTLVLTEALPVHAALKGEYSSYYLRRFYCALKSANPSSRVYLYQTWVNLQGADPYSKFPPAHRFDWRAEMVAQRKDWEELAAQGARTGAGAGLVRPARLGDEKQWRLRYRRSDLHHTCGTGDGGALGPPESASVDGRFRHAGRQSPHPGRSVCQSL